MKITFSKTFIIINTLYRYLKFKLPFNKNKNKNVLIVFHLSLGDSVILSNSLESYTKIYSKDKGYNVTFIAKPDVLSFMKTAFDLPKDINYEEVDFVKFLKSYSYYKKIIKKYSDYGTIIVPGTSLAGEIFSSCHSAIRRIGLVRYYDITHPFIMRLFNKIAYTEIVRPEKYMMMLQRYRLLVNYLGDNKYKAKIPKMKKQIPIIINKKYCVICPGASKTEKCWPIDNYVQVINYITKKNIEVHLCGGSNEIIYGEKILAKVKKPQKVISHIGNSNYEEWISIVQYASFVLGNDSATVHIAAASNVRSICLCGVYDKYQFFPYKVDELETNEFLPVSLMVDMPCEFCRTIGYFGGYNNKECQNRIKAGKCAICLEKITVKRVIAEVDKIINEVK